MVAFIIFTLQSVSIHYSGIDQYCYKVQKMLKVPYGTVCPVVDNIIELLIGFVQLYCQN